jgi:hypothetical protein
VLTESALALRKIARSVNERVYGFDRFVDVGVSLAVVRLDPKGEIALDSGRRVTVVRTHRWGGLLDTKLERPDLVGPSRAPRQWMCSEAQEPIVMHDDDRPLGSLVIGSEGSGKTTALAMWHHRMWILHGLGEFREGGQTAPVLRRLGLVQHEFHNLWAANWCRYVARDDFEGFELADGCRIRFQHTHRQSAAQGSPIQGFNWSWCGRDEMQDQVDVHADIESRGRAAKAGRYKQLGTATAKDDPEWRTLRDELVAGGQWRMSRLMVAESPFVAENFLAVKRASGITDREYRRRYLAEDVPPESRLYSTWDRAHNLRPLPLLGARKITSIVLRAKTGNPHHALLVGHDPGAAKAASIFLDAFEINGESGVSWWVRGELFTLHQTSEQHALGVLDVVRKFGCNTGEVINGVLHGAPERAHVRALPIGQAVDKADEDIYRIWSRVGLDIRSAQYKVDGTGTGHIPRESRIEMVKILLCDAAGRRRLFVDCDDLRRPKAPLLVEAFETLERDERGQPQKDKRIGYDKSDPPDALGYALWPWEKEAATALRAAVRKGVTRG